MRALVLAAATLAAAALSGCGTLSGGNGAEFTKALSQMASDPRCGHVDRIQGDIGGLGSGLHVFLERTCPPAPEAKPSVLDEPTR